MPIAQARHFKVIVEDLSAEVARLRGDLGEVRPGQMVRAIDQIIFRKPLKVIHGPVKTQFGWHLVQVFYRD